MTIEKAELKKKLLEVCVQKQTFLIEDFRSRIHALLSTDAAPDEELRDQKDLAQNVQKTIEANSIYRELEFANQELGVLNGLKNRIGNRFANVERGALVLTNHGSFFVSVSAEQITVEGNQYIGISDQSPLFVAMKGKKRGEMFACNGVHYKIKDIL